MACCLNACTLALVDAGVECKAMLAAVSTHHHHHALYHTPVTTTTHCALAAPVCISQVAISVPRRQRGGGAEGTVPLLDPTDW